METVGMQEKVSYTAYCRYGWKNSNPRVTVLPGTRRSLVPDKTVTLGSGFFHPYLPPV